MTRGRDSLARVGCDGQFAGAALRRLALVCLVLPALAVCNVAGPAAPGTTAAEPERPDAESPEAEPPAPAPEPAPESPAPEPEPESPAPEPPAPEPPQPGGDRQPVFGAATVSSPLYVVGAAIGELTLPAATGGDGALRYRLSPQVPGLRFTPARRTLTGTPSAVGDYRMTYRATDQDGDTASLTFTIAVVVDHADTRSAPLASVVPGSPITARIDTATDVDYFQVPVAAAGKLIAGTDFSGDLDTVVKIEGVPGYESDSRHSRDSVEVAGPGTYYIRVERDPSAEATSGSYDLAVWLIRPDTTYDIDLRIRAPALNAAQRTAIEAAAQFWRNTISGDLPAVIVRSSTWRQCHGTDPPAFGDSIDDLRIVVSVEKIDGRGGALAQAGPCSSRGPSAGDWAYFPVWGLVRFDVADFARIASLGLLQQMAVHEMAHVLGFGAASIFFNHLENPSVGQTTGRDTHFSGPLAVAEFNAIGPDYTGGVVPVENDVARWGDGGVDAHWRESVFGDELMTASLNEGSGADNPLSRVTLAALADMGYTVDYDSADTYALPSADDGDKTAGAARAKALTGRTLRLKDDLLPGPVHVINDADAIIPTPPATEWSPGSHPPPGAPP